MLNTHKKSAASGTADALVIFLHGYGADGKDLLGLADPLVEYLPDVTFLSPDAPDRCTNNPGGFQWFPIPWLDGSSEDEAQVGMERAVDVLNDWLDHVAEDEGIAPDRTVLVGFSQGTMMSLHVGPRRDPGLAGIVGFSGRLLAPEHLAEVKTKPPVLLIHGDMDDVVPPSSLPEAAEALSEAGFQVYTHVSQGVAHSIAPDGLGMALSLIRHVLGIEPDDDVEPDGEED